MKIQSIFIAQMKVTLSQKKYSPLGSLDQLMGCGKNMNVIGLLSPGIRVWGRSGEIKVNM